MDLTIKILGAIATVIIAFIVGMLYMGLNRKITARVQNRVGPPVWQNYIDALKLISKETSIHHGVMQHLAPAFLLISSIGTLLFVPLLTGNNWFPNLSFHGDLIFLLYLMVLGSLGMALGAGQSANPNAAIGVTRGLSQMVGFEIPWVMALVAIMIQYHTTSIVDIMKVQQVHGWLAFQNPFAFIAAILAMLGMFRYSPFDIVGAPAELASGPISEFGGKYLGLMMTSGSIFAFTKLTLYVDLFLGGSPNFIDLLIKTFVLYLIPMLYGLVSPRYRTEQAVRYFWGWPSFFGLVALIYSVTI
jgi:NADH-quinone oxidoreductase subunit H